MPTLLFNQPTRVLAQEPPRTLPSPPASTHDVQRERVRASLLLRPDGRAPGRERA